MILIWGMYELFKPWLYLWLLNQLIMTHWQNMATEIWVIKAQIMVCCLMAPSHYLHQCWFLISEVLWPSSQSNITACAKLLYFIMSLEIVFLKSFPHRGQYGKRCGHVAVKGSVEKRVHCSYIQVSVTLGHQFVVSYLLIYTCTYQHIDSMQWLH